MLKNNVILNLWPQFLKRIRKKGNFKKLVHKTAFSKKENPFENITSAPKYMVHEPYWTVHVWCMYGVLRYGANSLLCSELIL